MKRIFFGIGCAIGAAGRATVALVGICGVVAALANYTMTQGAGTTFGSIVVSTVHYAQQLLCDPTTPSQCQAVNSSGQASVAVASGAIVDGADATQGATTDAAATAGSTGSVSAKLRLMTTQLAAATPAGENHTGEVGGNLLPITNAMTTTNATVTTGQSIGGLQTLANAVRVSGSLGAGGTSGLVQSILLTFTDAVTVPNAIDVYFFNASPSGSTCTNASAFVLANADRTKFVGVVHVSDFTASNTAVVGQAMNLALPYGLASATSLFACVVARGSFAITSTANAAMLTNTLRN